MSDSDRRAISGARRRFIRQAVQGGGAMLAVASLPRMAEGAGVEGTPAGGSQGRGYRLTPHVVAYYRTLIE